MKIALTALWILLLTSTIASAAGFRDFQWGARQADVIKKEGRPVDKTEEMLIYKTTLAGMNMAVAFKFTSAGLQSGNYLSQEKRTAPIKYFDDYAILQDLLTKKYGKPKEQINWHDKSFSDQREHWGTALAAGHLSVGSEWMTPDSRVRLYMTGENFKVTLGLIYQNRATLEEAEKGREARDLDQL